MYRFPLLGQTIIHGQTKLASVVVNVHRSVALLIKKFLLFGRLLVWGSLVPSSAEFYEQLIKCLLSSSQNISRTISECMARVANRVSLSACYTNEGYPL